MSSVLFSSIPLEFNVGKVHRTLLDNIFTEPIPEPPTIKVTIWGGVEEDKYMYDDPIYIKQLELYNHRVYRKEVKVLRTAISYDKEAALALADKELYELTGDLLVTLLTQHQLDRLYNEVRYNSTVTPLGMFRALNMYNVRKFEEPILSITLPPSNIDYSPQYRDMLVASELGYTWREFISLSGQEQSNLVMFNTLKAMLKYSEEISK